MIAARHIFKYYGNNCVLNDISFNVSAGSIFGIMGANGAGKSTLFEIMATLIRDFQGELTIEGHNVRSERKQIHRMIGYVPGRFSLYGELTVEENLSYFADIYGCSAASIYQGHGTFWEGLAPFAKKQARYLSGGMKQKLSVCCALVHKPRILFLDEPTTGIDPRSRLELWRELVVLRNKGATILVSTHYLDEAEKMDKLLFLDRGHCLLLDTPANLRNNYDKTLVSVSGVGPYELFQGLHHKAGIAGCYLTGRTVRIPLDNGQGPESVKELCQRAGLTKAKVRRVEPTIEDVFIRHLSHDKTGTP